MAAALERSSQPRSMHSSFRNAYSTSSDSLDESGFDVDSEYNAYGELEGSDDRASSDRSSRSGRASRAARNGNSGGRAASKPE